MRCGKRSDQDFTQRFRAGQDQVPLRQCRQPLRQIMQRPGSCTDRTVRPLEKGLQPGDVVGVGMGDKNGGEIRRGQAQFLQGFGDAAAGDSGIYQQVGGAAGKQQRVSGGTAGQRM